MAHTFTPELKRDFRKVKKVTWRARDIYTVDGFNQFDDDMRALIDYLFQMAFGKKIASFAGKLRGDE